MQNQYTFVVLFNHATFTVCVILFMQHAHVYILLVNNMRVFRIVPIADMMSSICHICSIWFYWFIEFWYVSIWLIFTFVCINLHGCNNKLGMPKIIWKTIIFMQFCFVSFRTVSTSCWRRYARMDLDRPAWTHQYYRWVPAEHLFTSHYIHSQNHSLPLPHYVVCILIQIVEHLILYLRFEIVVMK